jgi:hypothetical protein
LATLYTGWATVVWFVVGAFFGAAIAMFRIWRLPTGMTTFPLSGIACAVLTFALIFGTAFWLASQFV